MNKVFIIYTIADRIHRVEITREELKQFGTGVKVLHPFIRHELEVWMDAQYESEDVVRDPAVADNRVFIKCEKDISPGAAFLTTYELCDCFQGNEISESTQEKLRKIREKIQENTEEGDLLREHIE